MVPTCNFLFWYLYIKGKCQIESLSGGQRIESHFVSWALYEFWDVFKKGFSHINWLTLPFLRVVLHLITVPRYKWSLEHVIIWNWRTLLSTFFLRFHHHLVCWLELCQMQHAIIIEYSAFYTWFVLVSIDLAVCKWIVDVLSLIVLGEVDCVYFLQIECRNEGLILLGCFRFKLIILRLREIYWQ